MSRKLVMKTDLEVAQEAWEKAKSLQYANQSRETLMKCIWDLQKAHKMEKEAVKDELLHLRRENNGYEDKLKSRDKEITELKADLSATKEKLNKFYGVSNSKEIKSVSANAEPENN